MKNLLFSLIFLCLSSSAFAQDSSIEDFFEKYTGLEAVTDINLSGHLLSFLFSDSDGPESELARKISKLRVLIVEQSDLIQKVDYLQFMKNVKKENFEEFMRFKDGGNAVDFHLREDGETITDVLITVNSEDGFILLSLEGLFKFSDLNDFDLNIEGAEHLKKIPESKDKIKRA